ncbi:MAG: phenylalanine--tRNA ligase subunit beta [Acidimicrobiia bacterium]
MKVPISWLADFMEIKNSVEEYVDKLNQLGFEVEGVASPGEKMNGLIIVKVLDTTPHPDADRLKLVDIDTGSEKKQIVCGAPNVRAGITVAYAPSGSTLPDGFKLEAKKIRGIVSDGMLCSARELGMGDSHEGLLELNSDLEAGQDVKSVLGLDDTIIELSITPNRPDAMSIVGIARELCAAFNQELKLPNTNTFLEGIEVDTTLPKASVEILDTDKCPRFLGRTLSVEVGPSPDWMVNRLQKCDQKTINNVVDVTNYVLLEWGRPLHVFDVDVMGSSDVVVRRANNGEEIVLLDETTRKLDENDLVVATKDGVARGLAGIMGGQHSGVYDTTKTVFLESAYFSPDTISKSSKRLGLRSESSARFERGIDPNFVSEGAHRACQLLGQVAKARISDIEVDVYPKEIERCTINLRLSRIEKILGDKVSSEDVTQFLTPLVDQIKDNGDNLDVTIPTFRPDLTREIDLIEEVARKRGLNSFEPTLPTSSTQVGGLDENQKKRRIVEDAFVGAGLCEAYTLPLEALETYEKFGYAENDLVKTKNALKSDASILRPMIIPGLVRSILKNYSKGISDVRFFEVGKVFNLPFDEDLLPDEKLHIAVAVSGYVDERPVGQKREIDVYDAVDMLNILTDSLRLDRATLIEEQPKKGFHPTRYCKIKVAGIEIGHIGEITSEPKCVGFEIDAEKLFNLEQKDQLYKSLSNYPLVDFDLAFVVDKETSSQNVLQAIYKYGNDEIEDVKLFDVFEGGNLGENKKSLAFNVKVRPKGNTFTDNDLSTFRKQVIEGVSKDCSAELR